jgi:dolichol kinase
MGIKKLKYIVFFGFLAIIASYFFDEIVAEFIRVIRNDTITSIMHFITDFGLLFLVVIIGFASFLQKKYRFAVFMVITGAIALEAAFLLKLIFHVPRPYVLGYEEPLFLVAGFSFPSIHASVLCALLPFQKYLFKKRTLILVYLIMFLIVFSRIYLGVHNASDIVAGVVIGLASTYSFLGIERQHRIIEWFKAKVTDKLELRRQTAHLIIGVFIVFLLKLQLINTQILFVIAAAGGILVLIARKTRIPFVHDLLEYLERPHHIARFPGRGSFFLVLGAALSTLIFEPNIAMASIMIMAVGDSVTNLVGRYFGKIKNPFNAKKNLEGTGVAIITGTLGALFFVPLWPAFIASVMSMAIESIDLGFKKYEIEIDDNVVIPLVAGIIMTIVGV